MFHSGWECGGVAAMCQYVGKGPAFTCVYLEVAWLCIWVLQVSNCASEQQLSLPTPPEPEPTSA